MRASVAPRHAGERGQVVVLLALGLVAMLAMGGLLVDGGMVFAQHRQAQSAADTAALAAAEAATYGSYGSMVGAAQGIAAANGFPKDLTDCSGTDQPNQGVVVNRPPSSGPHSAANDPLGAYNHVEVITTRAMRTAFAGAVGMGCWLVAGRAVSSIASSGVATCNLCALSDWLTYSTLLLDNAADLRVDGDIIVNQDNWSTGSAAIGPCGTSPCTGAKCSGANTTLPVIRMCGDSVWLNQTGGTGHTHLSARTISINAGWQTQNGNILTADQLAAFCPYHPEPVAYQAMGISPTPVANVCIGVPKIADPLNDAANPGNIIDPPDPGTLTVPVAGENGCPAYADVPTGTLASPNKLSIAGGPATSYHTICPGLYYGGFGTNGDSRSPKVTMLPGIYFMVGGGFNVTGTASIDGSGGVMIYNSSGTESFSSSSLPGGDLVPACDTLASTCLPVTITGTGNGLSASPGTTSTGTTVTYTMRVLGTPRPTGTITFYDGETPISGCADLPAVPVSGSTTKAQATCSTSYALFGTRGITGVYLGDAVYAPIGDTFTETINPPAGEAADNVVLNTITSPCATAPCGQVLLHAPTSGEYSGLLIFQARSSGLGLQIWPDLGATACAGTWMTDGVPPDTSPIPAPCGPLGGLSGTIYAPHQSTGSDDWDAVVNINATGLANVQIIAAQISLTYDQNVRFAYDPGSFANGRIHLVE
ncbi:MAG TPA: Ig-like domain-containing protein [Candidatus Eisenbacteria bacterium]|nr:Ig-like domain-containing protein [Candidatus Eisenbacteria bacterium]